MGFRQNGRLDTLITRSLTVDHVFGSPKSWIDRCYFLTKGLKHAAAEMSRAVLAHNINRLFAISSVSVAWRPPCMMAST